MNEIIESIERIITMAVLMCKKNLARRNPTSLQQPLSNFCYYFNCIYTYLIYILFQNTRLVFCINVEICFVIGQDGAEISCCVDGNDPVER